MTTAGIRDALTNEILPRGLAIGSIALLMVVLVARWWIASGREGPVPIAGLAFVVASALALSDTMPLPDQVLVGLTLLAAGGHIGRGSVVLGMVLALPGAVLLALESPTEPGWVAFAVAAVTAGGGVAVANFDRRYSLLALGPVLLGASFVGVYLTIPETDVALTVVGVVAVVAVAGWPLRLARLGEAGAFASVGLLSWVTATGGITRPSAVIGGLACLGVLVAEPLSRALFARRPRDHSLNAVVIVALHVVVVLLVARVAGLRSSTLVALVIASSVLVGATVLTAAWIGWSSRTPSGS